MANTENRHKMISKMVLCMKMIACCAIFSNKDLLIALVETKIQNQKQNTINNSTNSHITCEMSQMTSLKREGWGRELLKYMYFIHLSLEYFSIHIVYAGEQFHLLSYIRKGN
jgi:hypothetical protein